MRQRRLGRKTSRLDRGQSGSAFSRAEQAIWDQRAPDGFCDDPYCQQCDERKADIEHLIFQARAAAESLANAQDVPPDLREQLYNEAFQDAIQYLSGEHQHQLALVGAQEYERGRVTMQQSLQRVKTDSYQQGYRAGQLSNHQPQAQQENWEQRRQEMVDEMLDQCKIIAESNPNMKPGVNAVRHRIKKLKK